MAPDRQMRSPRRGFGPTMRGARKEGKEGERGREGQREERRTVKERNEERESERERKEGEGRELGKEGTKIKRITSGLHGGDGKRTKSDENK